MTTNTREPMPETSITIVTPGELAFNRFGFDESILAGAVAESSRKMYRRDFLAYAAYAGSPSVALRAETLARWRAHLSNETTLSPNTINRMIAAVKRIMREAGEQGYISAEVAARFNMVRGVRVVALKERQKQHARTLITVDDMRRLVAAPDTTTLAGKMHRALLETLATSGLRISEAVSLTVGQIKFGESGEGNDKQTGYFLLILGKNEREPSQRPLGRSAHAAIQEWLKARTAAGVPYTPYIFTSFAGRGDRAPSTKPIGAGSAWAMVQRYAGRLNLEHIKPHDFRRFVGTRLARKDIRLAQKALGHKRIETTVQHYVLDALSLGETDSLF